MGIVFVSSDERIRCLNELWDWIISAMWNDFETVVSEWWRFCEGGEILQIDKWLGANWQLLWKLTIFQCETRCGIDTGVGLDMPNKYSNQMGYTNGWQMVGEWQLMDGTMGRGTRGQKPEGGSCLRPHSSNCLCATLLFTVENFHFQRHIDANIHAINSISFKTSCINHNAISWHHIT